MEGFTLSEEKRAVGTAVIIGNLGIIVDNWTTLSLEVSEGDITADEAVKKFDEVMLPVVYQVMKMLDREPNGMEKSMRIAEITNVATIEEINNNVDSF